MKLLNSIAFILSIITIQAQMSPEKEAQLIKLMADQNIPGLSVCLIENGEIIYSKGFGLAKSDIPVTTETLFQAASLSKTYAAALVVLNSQNGLLNLDQPVNQYLTNYQMKGHKSDPSKIPTLRQLLSHTGGVNLSGFLGYKTSKHTVPTLDMILAGKKTFLWETAIKIKYPVIGQYEYSGGGYCVLQKSLEDIKGKSLDTIMKEEIFTPLAMSKSFYGLHPADELSFSHAHNGKGKEISGEYRLYPQLAAAGLWTTSSEYAKLIIEYMKAFKEESALFSKQSIDQILTATTTADGKTNPYGLGVMVKPSGEPVIRHTGQNLGFSSFFAANLESKVGMVILSNRHSTQWGEITALIRQPD